MNEEACSTPYKTWTRSEMLDLVGAKKMVFIGDSNVRTWYKDLIVYMKKEAMLTPTQCSSRIQSAFEGDKLIETNYDNKNARGRSITEHRRFRYAFKKREVVIEFYFITKLFSNYVQSIIDKWSAVSGSLEDDARAPDIIFIQSFCWDLTRWGPDGCKQYSKNLERLCSALHSCKSIKNSTVAFVSSPPLTADMQGGFIVPELGFLKESMRYHIMEARLFMRRAAIINQFDFVDVHTFLLRALHQRLGDGIHWSPSAIRLITHGLLGHLRRRNAVIRQRATRADDPVSLSCRRNPTASSVVPEEISANNSSNTCERTSTDLAPVTGGHLVKGVKDVEDNIVARILTRANLIEEQNVTAHCDSIESEEYFDQYTHLADSEGYPPFDSVTGPPWLNRALPQEPFSIRNCSTEHLVQPQRYLQPERPCRDNRETFSNRDILEKPTRATQFDFLAPCRCVAPAYEPVARVRSLSPQPESASLMPFLRTTTPPPPLSLEPNSDELSYHNIIQRDSRDYASSPEWDTPRYSRLQRNRIPHIPIIRRLFKAPNNRAGRRRRRS